MIEELNEIGRRRYVSPFDHAVIYAGLSDCDRAVRRLEEAVVHRVWRLVYLKSDPHFDHLRSSPGFMALLRRIGLPSS